MQGRRVCAYEVVQTHGHTTAQWGDVRHHPEREPLRENTKTHNPSLEINAVVGDGYGAEITLFSSTLPRMITYWSIQELP
jgi:hypothetical protein